MVQTLIWILCILLGISLAIGGTLLALRKKKPPPPPPPPSPPPGSPAPPTPPVYAPVPVAASARSWGWMWWVIIVVAIVFVGRWAWYEGRGIKSTYSPPQVAAPGTVFKERAVIEPLRLTSQEEKTGEFEFNNSPLTGISRYQVVFRVWCNSPTEYHLNIEGWPETFSFRVGQSGPTKLVFFGKTPGGKSGGPGLFRPGTVRMKLWSDKNFHVKSSYMELIYPE